MSSVVTLVEAGFGDGCGHLTLALAVPRVRTQHDLYVAHLLVTPGRKSEGVLDIRKMLYMATNCSLTSRRLHTSWMGTARAQKTEAREVKSLRMSNAESSTTVAM